MSKEYDTTIYDPNGEHTQIILKEYPHTTFLYLGNVTSFSAKNIKAFSENIIPIGMESYVPLASQQKQYFLSCAPRTILVVDDTRGLAFCSQALNLLESGTIKAINVITKLDIWKILNLEDQKEFLNEKLIISEKFSPLLLEL